MTCTAPQQVYRGKKASTVFNAELLLGSLDKQLQGADVQFVEESLLTRSCFPEAAATGAAGNPRAHWGWFPLSRLLERSSSWEHKSVGHASM